MSLSLGNTKKRTAVPSFTWCYEVLGVRWDVETAELAPAYQRKRREIGGDQRRLAELKKAYLVLANEKKRNAYDSTGMFLLGFLEHHVCLSLLVIVIFVFSLVACLFAFPILLSIKWDSVTPGHTSVPFSWIEIFIPLWILYGFSIISNFITTCCVHVPSAVVLGGDAELQEYLLARKSTFKAAIISTISSLLHALTEVFIGFTLDGTSLPWLYSWFLVLLPAMVAHFLRFVAGVITLDSQYSAVIKAVAAANAKANAAANAEGDALARAVAKASVTAVPSYTKVAFTLLFWPAVNFIQLFPIAHRANYQSFYPPPNNEPIPYNWFVAFLPIIVGTGLSAFFIGDQFVSTCLFYLLPVLLFCAKLDNPEIFSAFAIFSTFFALGILMLPGLLLMLCALLAVGVADPDLGNHDDVPLPAEQAQDPETTKQALPQVDGSQPGASVMKHDDHVNVIIQA